MQAHSDRGQPFGRFTSLLSEAGCPRPIHDEILLKTHECVVTPTLGSILPNWLLVIPRTSVVNFACWQTTNRVNPYDLVQAVIQQLNIAESRVIWFEHGPAEAGSTVGCGVDQAHLHLIVDAPFSFSEFVSRAIEASQLAWQSCSAKEAYRLACPNKSYLVAGATNQAIAAQNVDQVGSQFFRRVVADLADLPETWNYRTHPHFHNVEATLQRFRGDKPQL